MNISEIEALFPLSPLQRWMLASQTKGSLRTGEIVLEADRRLDPAVLRAAWNKLVGDNPGMRTAFAWKRVKHPLQFVRRVTTAGVEECDGISCKLDTQHNRYETAQPGPADGLAPNEPASDISPSEVPQWRVYLCCCSDSSYRLVFRYSRIAFDRLSARLLLGELFLTYDRLCGRTRDNEPKRPAFRDYIAAIAGEPDSAAGQFWRAHLEGLRSPTHLAIERQKSDAGNRHGSRLTHSIQFAPEDNDRLRRVTERISVHPRTLLHGAWAILLSRYSDTRDIVYGAVVPGRAAIIEGLDSMIGPFLNVLPVRTWIPGDRAFAPWLFELDSQLSGLDAYDYCSPDQFGGADGVGDETQLFGYVIDHDENPVIDDRSNLLCEEVGVRVSDETPAWEYPLTLRSRSAEALDASLIFDPSYYEPEDVGRLASSLRTLLLAIAEDPNRPISSIPIFSRTEAHQILVEWNECGREASENPSIEEMLHGVIEQSPESIAVSEAGSQLTYSRLEESAQRVAGYLRQIGVGPEFLVGVLALPSIEVIACLIGILRAGGAFLPLDPDYPMDRLSFMLRDASVHLLMGHSELLDQLPAFGGVTVSIDREWSVTNEYGGYAWRNAPIPRSLAYVIYTSGSTGEPKGVMVERRGITNLCESQSVGFEIGRDSRVVQFFSLGFDASVSEIFVTLLNGARLVMIQGQRTRMGDELIELMRAEQITAVTLPPSLLSVLEADGLPALRTVVSAGEACKTEIVQRWGRGRKFVNAYGPTETTVCATLGECGSADGIPAIGRPISRTKMYLLDRDMNPAPYGVPGEVFIAGIGVARGYVRRPS
ncbi:MAG: non-ribosomal peptide synthetase, partial [Blastocatellia bacterium]